MFLTFFLKNILGFRRQQRGRTVRRGADAELEPDGLDDDDGRALQQPEQHVGLHGSTATTTTGSTDNGRHGVSSARPVSTTAGSG